MPALSPPQPPPPPPARPPGRRILPRPLLAAAVTLGAALTLITTTLPAAAHVEVGAEDAVAGSFTAITFRVPNESTTSGTVKVSVELPQDRPLLSVASKPVPGWTVTTTKARLPSPVEVEGTTITQAVRTVTWTAESGTRIGPGEYQEFSLSVGPLPAAGALTLPATQTYADGTVVHWNEPTPASGDEPEHPAPTLMITAASPSASPSPTPVGAAGGSAGTDELTRGLAIAALVVAVAALALAVRSRRSAG